MTLSYDDAIAIVERRAEFANLPEKYKRRQAAYYLGCDLADEMDFLKAIKPEDGSPHKARWLKDCRDVTEMLDKALHEWRMMENG